MMAAFPKVEVSIKTLATTVLEGCREHADIFSNIDTTALEDAITKYNLAIYDKQEAAAMAKITTKRKNQALEELIELLREDLKLAEVDTADNPKELSYIGWSNGLEKSKIQPPLSPSGLVAIFDGTGYLSMKWDKPKYDTQRPVYNYVIQRRDQIGKGEFGDWFMVDMVYKNQTTLLGQPSDLKMEYRIIATNPSGQSPESNSVCVILK